jgi:TonB family protein
MNARMALANILSFAMQVAVVVAAGAALARALRIDEPRAMLAYWRALLLACLLLPLLQPWHIVVPPSLRSTPTEIVETAVVTTAVTVSEAPRSTPRPFGELVLTALAAGIAVRALWLLIGAFGLRRLRREALPFEPLPASVRHAQERTGAQAGMYVSHRVSSPITFGVIRPVVLFPTSVSTMPAPVQEAIACHELIHVQRRDWLHEVAEELLRALLWFHPGIWWLIGRIRLTREQVVDQAAIRLIDSRERYVEALLAVAVGGSPTRFVPASPFLRRHLLKKRVARILQETAMSTRRLIASFTVSAAALAIAAAFAVKSFPLEAQGKAPADSGQPIQLVRGGEQLLHGDLPEYPGRAIKNKVEGDVVVEMTLNDRGEVSDARVLSGPEELRRATLEAVLRWHYAPAAMSSTSTQATVRFKVPELNAEDVEKLTEVEKLKVHDATLTSKNLKKHGEYDLVELKPEPHESEHLATYSVALRGDHELAKKSMNWKIVELRKEPKFDGTSRLVDLITERVPEAAAKEVLAQAGVALGDPVTEDTVKRIRQAAVAMDEHFLVRFHEDKMVGGVIVTILTR